jgi:nucleoside-diphosphate-sugar epimerase
LVGVTAILHLATPVDAVVVMPAAEVLHAALSGTNTILQSAMKAGPQLRSFVFMSSTAAIFDTPAAEKLHTEADWNNTSEDLVAKGATESVVIYSASKAASERAVWKFRDEKKPPFAVTTVQAQ